MGNAVPFVALSPNIKTFLGSLHAKVNDLGGNRHMHRGSPKINWTAWDLGDPPVEQAWELLRPGEAEKD